MSLLSTKDGQWEGPRPTAPSHSYANAEEYSMVKQSINVNNVNTNQYKPKKLYVLKILPKNSKARRSFITNGHLKFIQSLTPDDGSDLFEVIKAVNCCFPEDIIQ